MAMSQRKYAEYRRTRGLPGGTLRAVQRAIQSGRIPVPGATGIDAEIADREWELNTHTGKQSNALGGAVEPPTPPDTAALSDEAAAGAIAIIHCIRRNARPCELAAVLGAPGPVIVAAQAILDAVLVHACQELLPGFGLDAELGSWPAVPQPEVRALATLAGLRYAKSWDRAGDAIAEKIDDFYDSTDKEQKGEKE